MNVDVPTSRVNYQLFETQTTSRFSLLFRMKEAAILHIFLFNETELIR